MFQNGLDLRPRHARKPFKELSHRCAVLDVIEQRVHGHARAAKYPGAARDARVLFNSLACTLVQHDYTLLRKRWGGKWRKHMTLTVSHTPKMEVMKS